MKRNRTCSYIYTDGTLIEIFEERRDGVEIGQTVDVTLGYCTLDIAERTELFSKQHKPNGRIVIHNRYTGKGFTELAKGGHVAAMAPSYAEGSPNSQSKHIKVQSVKLTTKAGYTIQWTDTDVICSEFTIQPDENFKHGIDPERCYAGASWGGDARIWKITDLRPKSVEQQTVA